ncbi:hypothetical protein GCK32_009657 [Trichostrongylus colubriformis]|uniref:Uncharacterized protein n=1 Tax=Trichostrongylus colubriformis TaxID=6319 RepID=A0AAN8IHW7_TRICO
MTAITIEHPSRNDQKPEEVEEVIQQCEGSPKRARAGSDNGCCENETFLIVLSVVMLVFALFDIVDYRHATTLKIIFHIALLVLIIVGVCQKSSMCMLIALILLIIIVIVHILYVLYIVFASDAKLASWNTIVAIILEVILIVICIYGCISANALRSEY